MDKLWKASTAHLKRSETTESSVPLYVEPVYPLFTDLLTHITFCHTLFTFMHTLPAAEPDSLEKD